MKKLEKEQLEKVSGYESKLHQAIPRLKHSHYQIISGISVGGDAPKELVKMYLFEPGFAKVHNKNLWPAYIVKTGHKWYPYESITEYLLNRLGSELGLNMAQAGIIRISD
jgi:hypothetical protein